MGVLVKLPGKTYDELYRRAQQERVSLPEVIRRALAIRHRHDDDVTKE